MVSYKVQQHPSHPGEWILSPFLQKRLTFDTFCLFDCPKAPSDKGLL